MSRRRWWWCWALAGCATGPAVLKDRELPEAIRPRRAELVMRCTPPDAEVALDGVAQGSCQDFAGEPRGLPLRPGAHRVRVTKPGHTSFEGAVDADGSRVVLRVTLVKRE